MSESFVPTSGYVAVNGVRLHYVDWGAPDGVDGRGDHPHPDLPPSRGKGLDHPHPDLPPSGGKGLDHPHPDLPPSRGKGVLLLLHGDMRTARSWDAVARELRGEFHVVAQDARGHGDSEWPETGYTFAQRVDDLEGVHGRGWGCRGVSVAAHSTGGVVAAAAVGTAA